MRTKILFIFFCLGLTLSSLNAKTYYMVTFKIWQKETFSLNVKNSRNAIRLDLPVDKAFFDSIEKGKCIHENNVYENATDIMPKFFTKLVVIVEEKKVIEKNDIKSTITSADAQKRYIATINIWQNEMLSFDIKNKRNAVKFPIPLDKDFYNSIKEGKNIQENSVYKSAFSIIPKLFSNYVVQVTDKKIETIK